MNILLLCHKTPYPPNDGGTIATLNMIKGFAYHGDHVCVLTMQTPKHAFPVNQIPESLKTNIDWYQVYVDTRINPFKLLFNLMFSKKPYNAVRFESNQFNAKLHELLITNNFDAVQLEGAYLSSYVQTIRKNSAAKISLRAHNVEYEIWQRLAENEASFIKRLYYNVLARRIRSIEKQLVKNVDCIVPITQRDGTILNADSILPMHTSQTGIEQSVFRKSEPTQPKTIFYIGALDWIPNQEAIKWFITQVWDKIYTEFVDWQFVIAGRNAPVQFISYLKNQNVKFVGEVENAYKFIDDHNLMVVPLQSGSGMRIKIIEGMARAKCIVTTSVGAEGISAENKKELYVTDSGEDTKRIIKQLMQNPEEIKKCAENAFIFVQQNFNNNKIIGELRDFYAKQISNS